jgi:hypothetical protein
MIRDRGDSRERIVFEPLHTAIVGGHELRFFKIALAGSLPDIPWHAVDDLHRCLGLNRETRRVCLRKLKADWGKDVRTVATPDGVVSGGRLIGLGWRTANLPSSRTSWRKAGSTRWSTTA